MMAWLLGLLSLGSVVLYVLGIVTLQDRFHDTTTDAERAYNRRRNRQGYAALAGAGAWWFVAVVWFIVRG